MFVDLKLDRYKKFNVRFSLFSRAVDGSITPINIKGWAIKGAVIICLDDESFDIPLSASIVNDGSIGLFDLKIADADRDEIFSTYEKKHSLSYEVRANFFNGQGCMLAQGNLILKRSRALST
jgi:hypothetical protein